VLVISQNTQNITLLWALWFIPSFALDNEVVSSQNLFAWGSAEDWSPSYQRPCQTWLPCGLPLLNLSHYLMPSQKHISIPQHLSDLQQRRMVQCLTSTMFTALGLTRIKPECNPITLQTECLFMLGVRTSVVICGCFYFFQMLNTFAELLQNYEPGFSSKEFFPCFQQVLKTWKT
jgi:hypothetical protein